MEIVDIGLKNLAARSSIVLPLVYLNLAVPLIACFWLLWRDSAPGSRRPLGTQAAE